MNVNAYIQLVTFINDFAEQHIGVHRFKAEASEQLPNFSNEGEAFPILFMTPLATQFQSNVDSFTVRIYCLDLIQADRANINQIWSDTNLILNDLKKWFTEGNNQTWEIVGDPIATPINNALLDKVGGFVMDMTFLVPTYCSDMIPFSGSPFVGGEAYEAIFSRWLTCETVVPCLTGNTDFNNYLETFLTGGTGGQDIFVTGGTYSNGTATFTNNTGGTFNVSGFKTDDIFVTGGTKSGSVATFTNNTGGTFNVSGFTDIFVTGGTYNNSTGTATFTNNSGGTFNVTGFSTGGTGTDTYVTGFTFNPATYNLNLSQNNGSSFNADLSILSSDVTVTGGTYNPSNGSATFTNNTGGTFTVTGFLTGGTISNDSYWTSGSTWNGTNYPIKANNDSGLDATGAYAVAEGQGTVARGVSSHAEGTNTTANGNYSHSEGQSTTAEGDWSHSEGANTTANGQTAHAEGWSTTANNHNAHAEGDTTIANGEASHSEGSQTTATGNYSHAEGTLTLAYGPNSHAEGNTTRAVGESSHVEGYLNISNGAYSHSEGKQTTSDGVASHAEGALTTAIGDYSHAGGYQSIASGTTSFVHGYNSMALSANTIVFGANITGASENTVYVPNIQFDLNAPSTMDVGRMEWNDTDGTVDLRLKGNNLTLQIGEDIVVRVVNKTNTNLSGTTYSAVRVRNVTEGGAQGQRLAIVLAQANTTTNAKDTIGLVAENIANNQEGFVMLLGQIHNINTTGSLQGETWVDGDVLYLSPTTAGGITKVKPIAPNKQIVIGYVEYAHATNGKIYVNVQNGYDINDLNNVSISGTPTNGQGLTYSSTLSAWTNTTLAPSTDVDITGGTKSGTTLILTNSTGGTINITGFTDTFVTGATKTNSVATFTNNTGGTFTLTGLTSITGGTYSNSTGNLTLNNNAGASVIVTGFTTPTSFQVYRDTSTYTHTGTLAETLVWSALIPANTFQSTDLFTIEALTSANSNANSKAFRWYFNTGNTLTGAVQIAAYTPTTTGLGANFHRNIFFYGSANQRMQSSTTNMVSSYSQVNAALTTTTFNIASDIYLILSCQLNNTGDTMSILNNIGTITR
jgi:hypothetical protein